MATDERKPIKILIDEEKWQEGQKVRGLLGDVRLMAFLEYLRNEEPTFWVVMFFQKLERGESLDTLLAPKSGFRLKVQKEQSENQYIILFGFYTSGHRLGHIANDYYVTFDEVDAIQEVVPRRCMRG